jgi:uncharacterized protein (DUF58 family)
VTAVTATVASAADVASKDDEPRRVAAQAVRNTRAARVLRRVRRSTGLTNAGLVLAGIVVASWALAYWVGGKPLYLLSYGSLLVLVASWTIGRRPLPVAGTREQSRGRLQEGETIDVDIALTAERRLSTIVLEEQVPPELGLNAQVPVPSLESGDSVGHGYQLTLARRGSYTLGPLVARWGDPFGLTERELVLAEPFEVLVHPRVEPVQDRPLTRLWEDPPIRPPVSRPWPSGMEFYGMRQYVPGDDVRKVVWRAFARTGQLLVRESEQGITDKMTIVLDTGREFHSPMDPVSESFETGVRTAASLAAHHFREGYDVILEGSADKIIGPLRGGSAKMTMLDELARVQLDGEKLPEALSRVSRTSARGRHVVVITPYLEDDAITHLRLMIERGSSVLVCALVWDELAVNTLSHAAAMGARVIEIRPHLPLAVAFRHLVGAGA